LSTPAQTVIAEDDRIRAFRAENPGEAVHTRCAHSFFHEGPRSGVLRRIAEGLEDVEQTLPQGVYVNHIRLKDEEVGELATS
jgi:hypothetical protein